LLALGAAFIQQALTRRRERLVVKDSSPFARALHIWEPLVFLAIKTPRGLKRFLNRVRYLAMGARRDHEPSRWERLIRSEPQPEADPSPSFIPEPALVALAAIHALDPALLPGAPASASAPPARDPAVLVAFSQAGAQHAKEFGETLADLERHRVPYLERAAGLRVN
jgi:hypothetical protein